MGNILHYRRNNCNDIVPVNNWTWSDFRDAWKQFAELSDDDTAWRIIYEIWKVRAGEDK